MKRYYEGKYNQMIEIKNNKIVKMNCTCPFSSLYPNNWEKGNKICKHLTKIIKEL